MSYLHSHNILHRDLKPEIIYVDDLFFQKLTGFHLSKELPANTEICNEIKGTPIYLSPEVYTMKEYSKASDVYAFSLVMDEIITNKKPLKNLTNSSMILKEVVQNKKRPEFDENIPECFKNLIEKCWSDDPNDRPTFEEIIHTLRTDSNFFTSTVNPSDYHKNIGMIDESNTTFTPEAKLTYEDITKMKLNEFHKNGKIQSFRFSVLGIYETEINNITPDFEEIEGYKSKRLIWYTMQVEDSIY
ncbi:hypothetical protein M9Y10_003378 [Tritrichomonas musculus]|uniref:Protein kinase domain-containing protein n=1 Tax=Tritrichomonas musculus TaxID=1915356 RepID=A0ABR2JPZ1_9EUKA